MIIIGLTGGIGMGKTTAANILRSFGFPTYSADRAVHDVLKKGGAAVAPVSKAFPETLRRGGIDRKRLADAVFGNPAKLRRLERIVHPLIRKAERDFLAVARKKGARAAILEIPLLFEIGAHKRCNVTFCVTAPAAVQKKRVMARKGMDEQKFRAIVARQMSNAQRRKCADYLVPTGASEAATQKHLEKILKELGLL